MKTICWRAQEKNGGRGIYWRTSRGNTPDLLDVPVALVPPDATGAGVVVEVDLAGEPLTDVPLYHSERRKPTVYPL